MHQSYFKPNKYNAQKTAQGFDSKQEQNHYLELELMQKAGEISNLARQKHIKLYVNGQLVTSYRADATFTQDGKQILWESKGFTTEAWGIKRKLIIALLPELGFDEFWIWYNTKREVHKAR